MQRVFWGVILIGLITTPATAQPSREEILQACSVGQADQLPNPFVDLTETDWAYNAVLTLYYCGAFRGAISQEHYLRYLDSLPNSSSPQSNT